MAVDIERVRIIIFIVDMLIPAICVLFQTQLFQHALLVDVLAVNYRIGALVTHFVFVKYYF